MRSGTTLPKPPSQRASIEKHNTHKSDPLNQILTARKNLIQRIGFFKKASFVPPEIKCSIHRIDSIMVSDICFQNIDISIFQLFTDKNHTVDVIEANRLLPI